MSQPLQSEMVIPLTNDRAFALFTEGFASWWPAEFSWSGVGLLEDIGIESRPGGFLYECGPHGLRLDWGRVLAWEPPHRLLFTWQIGPDRVPVPDRARASEVEVTLTTFDPSQTHVAVTHRHWERHGPEGDRYRDNFAQVWPYALQRFHDAASGASKTP